MYISLAKIVAVVPNRELSNSTTVAKCVVRFNKQTLAPEASTVKSLQGFLFIGRETASLFCHVQIKERSKLFGDENFIFMCNKRETMQELID